MSRYVGGVEGKGRMVQRVGTQRSGMKVHAASGESRVDVELHGGPGFDWANISIYGERGRHHLPGFNLELVAAALDSGDPKTLRIWNRIQSDIRRLHDDAPKAIKRAERRRRNEEEAAQREHALRLETQRAFAETITDAEAEHFIALTGLTNDESDREALLARAKHAAASPEVMEPRRKDGHLFVATIIGIGWDSSVKFLNLTDGIEVDLDAVPVV